MSVLSSTNSGKNAPLTENGLRKIGWDSGSYFCDWNGTPTGYSLRKHGDHIVARYTNLLTRECKFSITLKSLEGAPGITIRLTNYKDVELFENYLTAKNSMVKRRYYKMLLAIKGL